MSSVDFQAFARPGDHRAISAILRRRSKNTADVREALLAGLDLSRCRRVLDLGCGFGFMAAAVARRVAPDAELVGVDAWATNEQPFLDAVTTAGRRGRFVCRRLEHTLDWPERTFDLVLASYALYFFPDVLPDIPRVMTPDGVFIATTHTETSCRALLDAVDMPPESSPLMPLIRNFSVERAEELLRPWFDEVRRVDYANALAFEAGHVDDLLTYLRFKTALFGLPARPAALPEGVVSAAHAAVARPGGLVLEKNDAAFHCRRPRCR